MSVLEKASGDTTGIDWMIALARSQGRRAKVWNPVRGCSRAGRGCRNCWAARVADMRARHPTPAVASRYEGLTERDTEGVPRFTGRIRFDEDVLDRPRHVRHPTLWFVQSEGDLWHPKVDRRWRMQILRQIASAPQHTFILLTKRPRAMVDDLLAPEALGFAGEVWPLPNLAVGVSVWDRESAHTLLPQLAPVPAALRIVSAEPLLGSLHLRSLPDETLMRLGWVIGGGESGPHAFGTHPQWALELRDDAAEAGIPFFWKQWGELTPATEVEPAIAAEWPSGRRRWRGGVCFLSGVPEIATLGGERLFGLPHWGRAT